MWYLSAHVGVAALIADAIPKRPESAPAWRCDNRTLPRVRPDCFDRRRGTVLQCVFPVRSLRIHLDGRQAGCT